MEEVIEETTTVEEQVKYSFVVPVKFTNTGKPYSFGTENGSYSFVIDPRSISRIVCEYEYVIKKCEIQNEVFDTIKLRYFDERNKEHLFTLRNVSNCWEEKTYEADKDWILAK